MILEYSHFTTYPCAVACGSLEFRTPCSAGHLNNIFHCFSQKTWHRPLAWWLVLRPWTLQVHCHRKSPNLPSLGPWVTWFPVLGHHLEPLEISGVVHGFGSFEGIAITCQGKWFDSHSSWGPWGPENGNMSPTIIDFMYVHMICLSLRGLFLVVL